MTEVSENDLSLPRVVGSMQDTYKVFRRGKKRVQKRRNPREWDGDVAGKKKSRLNLFDEEQNSTGLLSKPHHGPKSCKEMGMTQALDGVEMKKGKGDSRRMCGGQYVKVPTGLAYESEELEEVGDGDLKEMSSTAHVLSSELANKKMRQKKGKPRKHEEKHGLKDKEDGESSEQSAWMVDGTLLKKRSCEKDQKQGAERSASVPRSIKPSRTSKLMMKFHGRLMSGHFRYLNEKLYSGSGEENFAFMHKDKTIFEEYHRGYCQQMKTWSKLPVEVAISWLKKRPDHWKVADFGCGDARLEKEVPQVVSSLDLVALEPCVIECNMAHTPLESQSHDCAVFCLALMGRDYPDYLEEAGRILKRGGVLWIAEVCSRFVTSGNKEDYGKFDSALESLGFKRIKRSWPSNYFVVTVYRKEGQQSCETLSWPKLKVCMYKHR